MTIEIIEQLEAKDTESAVKLFKKGLAAEIPRGELPDEAIYKELDTTLCLVYKKGKNLNGLVNFKLNKSRNITLMFICVSEYRKKIGLKLLHRVACIGSENGARWIYAGVSRRDARAVGFYKSLGFRSYKRTGHRGYYIRAKPYEILQKVEQKIHDLNCKPFD
jgi:hypothetical protein